MLAWSFDHEILTRRAGRDDLGADARIGRLQGAGRQVRPVAADGGGETLAPARIDLVVDLLHPFHIRPEARLPRQIQRQMGAEPSRHGHGIDEP